MSTEKEVLQSEAEITTKSLTPIRDALKSSDWVEAACLIFARIRKWFP